MKIVKWLDNNFELVIMAIALSVLTVVVLIDVIGEQFLEQELLGDKKYPETVRL